MSGGCFERFGTLSQVLRFQKQLRHDRNYCFRNNALERGPEALQEPLREFPGSPHPWGPRPTTPPWPPRRSTVPRGLRLATRPGYSSTVYSKSVGMFSKVQSFKIIRPLSNCMSYKVCPRGEFGNPPRNPLNFPAWSPRMRRPTQPCASSQCNTVSHGAPTSDSSRANPFVGQYPGGSLLET